MKPAFKSTVIALVTMLATHSAIAQESFAVSGPVEFFCADYLPACQHSFSSGFVFSSTITYLPDAVPDQTFNQLPIREISNFDRDIVSVETSLYDSFGSLVNYQVDFGTGINRINVADAGPDGTADFFRFRTVSFTATTGTASTLTFMDETKQMITNVLEIPEIPVVALITSATFASNSDDFSAGTNLFFSGPVVDITDVDPIADCGQDARNHGQLVSCIADVTNELRRLGDISGREKGESQSEAARGK